ncbi:hypothetical protein ACFWDP_41120, partial [Streptomyces anthocyanicus]
MTTDTAKDWKHWREQRPRPVFAPHGSLTLQGTHRIEDHQEGRIPDMTGRWTVGGDGVLPAAGESEASRWTFELAFTLGGQELTPQVTVQEDGSPWAVLGDSSSGHGSYRFRFPKPAAPDARGRTTGDFNPALLLS